MATEISSIAYVAGFLSLVAGLMMIVFSFSILKKYREKKLKATLYLYLSIWGWFGAIFSVLVIYFLAGTVLEVAIWCQKLVYTFVFIATMLTYLFASEIFFTAEKKWTYIYLALGIAAITITIIMDSVEVAEFPDGSDYPLLTIGLAYSLLIVAYIVPTVLGIFVVAWKSSRKIDDPLYKLGYKIIALGQLMLLMTFVVDTLATVFIDNVAVYSLFLYLTWVFPVIAALFYVLGWTLPEWLKKFVKETP